MKSYPTKFKSFLWKIVPMGTLQKLQNSIQTLTIFWPVYPIHTNSLIWVIFVELPFCHFPPPNTFIRGQDSKIQLIFHLNILVFQTNGKQPYSFPVLSRFCNGPGRVRRARHERNPREKIGRARSWGIGERSAGKEEASESLYGGQFILYYQPI